MSYPLHTISAAPNSLTGRHQALILHSGDSVFNSGMRDQIH